MTNLKKLFLSAFMLMLGSVSCLAQYVEADGLKFSLNPDKLTARVVPNNYGNDTYDVPESVEYEGKTYTVTELAARCFANCTNLTGIWVPATVNKLGFECFVGCSQLDDLYGFEGVRTLGQSCFNQCTSLSTFTFYEGLESLPQSCFQGCQNLHWVVIPSTVTSLGKNCFASCPKLSSVDLPDGLKSIGDYCFDGCERITTLKLPEGLETMGSAALRDCTGLTSLSIPSGISVLPPSCFSGCTGLTSLSIPSGISVLPPSCFSGCTNLASVSIPSSVTKLGDYSFYGCKGLTSFTVSSHVDQIGASCFSNCTGLTAITIPSNVSVLGESCFKGCSNLTSVAIEEGVTSLPASCFADCSQLSTITIPFSVTAFGNSCFSGCSQLSKLNIPSSVTVLGDGCFSNCRNLRDIELPYSLKSVGKYCFGGTSVLLHSLPYIQKANYESAQAFESFVNITVELNDQSYVYTPDAGSSENYVLATDGLYVSSASFNRSIKGSWTSLVIPFNVTLTGDESFKLYKFDGIYGDGTVQLNHVEGNLEAGAAYMVYCGEKSIDLESTSNIGLSNELKQRTAFTGTYANQPITDGYFLSGDKFWSVKYALEQQPSAKGVMVTPFHAWLDDSSNATQSLSLRFNDGSATGIGSAPQTEVLSDPTATIYDLSGKRLSAPQCGVNIVRTADGRTQKIIVK